MSVANVRFSSEALGKWTRYNVILPDVGEGPFPVLLQLHGLSDDGDAWLERSNLVRHVAQLPLVVVLPDGGTSGYLNWQPAGRWHQARYEDLLIHDLPDHLQRHFHVTDGPWAIGGLSMGGYGAMRLGLKYPDRFASIYAHSSPFTVDEDNLDPALVETSAEDASVYHHADVLATRRNRPVIAFDCGTADWLDGNRQFHVYLQQLNIAHHYTEYPGGHEWDYWDEHVRDALAQHAKVLGLA